jgi:GT2 family glycosyltransferase
LNKPKIEALEQAITVGATYAKGEFLLLLNTDTLLTSDVLPPL